MENIVKYSLVKEKTALPVFKISQSLDAHQFLASIWQDIDIYESMYLLVVNRANIVEGFVKLSQGGIAGTVFDVKLLATYALQALASGVVLAHNHPSGQLKPSDADLKITKIACTALANLDIALLDHLILSESGFYSMKDNGDF